MASWTSSTKHQTATSPRARTAANTSPRRRQTVHMHMADGKQGNAAGAPPAMAEDKKAQARVRELVERRRTQERRLAQMEDSIAHKESAYLDSNPAGNIITGFDNYMKGTSGGSAQRRKAGSVDQNRVFSRSSISYRPNNADSSTPGASTPMSHTPTPLSASFRDSGSMAHPTPTPATGNKSANKPKKKDPDESEGDSQSNKKRTNFGASRK
ncbi:Histone H4 acetyltransferase, NuA4 complex, Eaf6 [Ophiocordyceps sinensis CO18]|uniref:Chromatin modification-related protein EAF6 n=1 Tax=Ophiocordyceps sinensis (strain Co18 / CGMCC 3.14243) TaxID=911162 RepID=T5AFN4_OPHSC|nr:Histone H4 acetyltransferase, NuA4 complex, Eaf6 [Ophiocordyceps sinensis CO18]